jgi:FkbM family methyltransferase
MRDRNVPPGERLGVLKWNRHPIHYRPGTSDLEIIYSILLQTDSKVAYRVPAGLNPQVILDIGANIGAASLYFARLFPQAHIHAFEPIPDNFTLLARNAAPFPNIYLHHMALGGKSGRARMLASNSPLNLGGFSFYAAGSDPSRTLEVEMKHPDVILAELGIHQVDLIKIDTEGAEYEILTSFSDSVLGNLKWITGELHGERDFELLAFLSRWFDCSVNKTLNSRLSTFAAINKAI